MNADKIAEYSNMFLDWAVVFVPKILIALAILIIGFYVVKKLMVVLGKGLSKTSLDYEITEFLKSLLETVMKIAVILFAVSTLGIEMTAIIGLLAAAGFAVGMALQGFLGNFASGLTILFLKPYKVGDWVKVSDHFGKCTSIQIFNTTLVTPNDKTLIIPNGQVTDNIITNFSTEGNIRLELKVTMPYEESFPKVKEVIQEALDKSEFVLKDRAASIGIEEYESHNIVVAVRPYIHPDDYWNATFEVYGLIKGAFHKHGIRAAYSEGVELGPIGD